MSEYQSKTTTASNVEESPTVSSGEGSSDLLELVAAGDTDRIRDILLEQKDSVLVNSIKDWAGDSLLATACWYGNKEIVKMLLGFGANIDSINSTGSTPLHRACYKNDLGVIEILLEFGADYSIKDRSGRTASDVGDGLVKRLIDCRKEDVETDMRQQIAEMEAANASLEAIQTEIQGKATMERIKRRQQQVVD